LQAENNGTYSTFTVLNLFGLHLKTLTATLYHQKENDFLMMDVKRYESGRGIFKVLGMNIQVRLTKITKNLSP
jgi:hypothetical protein